MKIGVITNIELKDLNIINLTIEYLENQEIKKISEAFPNLDEFDIYGIVEIDTEARYIKPLTHLDEGQHTEFIDLLSKEFALSFDEKNKAGENNRFKIVDQMVTFLKENINHKR